MSSRLFGGSGWRSPRPGAEPRMSPRLFGGSGWRSPRPGAEPRMSPWSGRKLLAGLAVLEVAAVVLVLVLKRFDGLDLEVYLGGAKALAEHGSPYDAWLPTSHSIQL